MSDDSKAEEVRFGPIVEVGLLAGENLRSHEGQSATFLVLALFFQVKDHAEVNDGRFHTGHIDHNVFRLEVSVNDVPLVALDESFCNSSQDGLGVFGGQVAAGLDDRHQVLSLQVFGEDDELIAALEDSLEL